MSIFFHMFGSTNRVALPDEFKTTEDLLVHLGVSKAEMKKIWWFRSRMYSHFDISKSNGKKRIISAPDRRLKMIQRSIAERWRGIEGHPYEQGFDLRLWPARLKQPGQWRKPRMIFVNSMSDLFHKSVPREFIDRVFDAMEEAPWHVYQVLTKRSSLMRNYVKKRYEGRPVPTHIWLGVSVENAAHIGRIDHLRQINSEALYISFEPPWSNWRD